MTDQELLDKFNKISVVAVACCLRDAFVPPDVKDASNSLLREINRRMKNGTWFAETKS